MIGDTTTERQRVTPRRDDGAHHHGRHHARRSGTIGSTGPHLDEWLVGVLAERDFSTLDELGMLLPAANWAQLFLAVDRLSRQGIITLRSDGPGSYRLRLAAHPATAVPVQQAERVG